eukprot:5447922-Pleurochrysis_carterae.AAC.2
MRPRRVCAGDADEDACARRLSACGSSALAGAELMVADAMQLRGSWTRRHCARGCAAEARVDASGVDACVDAARTQVRMWIACTCGGVALINT